MAKRASEPASNFRMQDLEFELGDALQEMFDIYWDPIYDLAEQYLVYFEAQSKIAAGLASLAGKDEDEQFAIADGLAEEVDPRDIDEWLDSSARLDGRYEDRRGLVIDYMTLRIRDRFLEKHAGVLTARSLSQAFEWIGIAMASGVAGNLAYDALKKSWGVAWTKRLRRIVRRTSPGDVNPDEALQYLVKIAVRDQCHRAQFPIPVIAALRVVEWTPGAQSVAARLASDSPELQAVVEVPYSGMEDIGIQVSVSRPQ